MFFTKLLCWNLMAFCRTTSWPLQSGNGRAKAENMLDEGPIRNYELFGPLWLAAAVLPSQVQSERYQIHWIRGLNNPWNISKMRSAKTRVNMWIIWCSFLFVTHTVLHCCGGDWDGHNHTSFCPFWVSGRHMKSLADAGSKPVSACCVENNDKRVLPSRRKTTTSMFIHGSRSFAIATDAGGFIRDIFLHTQICTV